LKAVDCISQARAFFWGKPIHLNTLRQTFPSHHPSIACDSSYLGLDVGTFIRHPAAADPWRAHTPEHIAGRLVDVSGVPCQFIRVTTSTQGAVYKATNRMTLSNAFEVSAGLPAR